MFHQPSLPPTYGIPTVMSRRYGCGCTILLAFESEESTASRRKSNESDTDGFTGFVISGWHGRSRERARRERFQNSLRQALADQQGIYSGGRRSHARRKLPFQTKSGRDELRRAHDPYRTSQLRSLRQRGGNLGPGSTVRDQLE